MNDNNDNEPVRLRFRDNNDNQNIHNNNEIKRNDDKNITMTTTIPTTSDVNRNLISRHRQSLSINFDDDPLGKTLMPAVTEFIGTLIYVLITNLLGISGNNSISKLGISIFDGITMTSLILMLSSYGGYHFNPAITLGSMMTLNTKWILGICIIFCQLFGAFFGSLLSRATLNSSTFMDMFNSLSIIQITIDYNDNNNVDYAQFSNRFQVYLLDSILTSFLVMSFIFVLNDGTYSDISTSVGITKSITTYISMQSIGQSGNFARLLANNAIASIFIMDSDIWRLFYLFFFSTITAPIIAAIFYWILKTVRLPRLDITHPMTQQQQTVINNA